jgi:hypothetical protein
VSCAVDLLQVVVIKRGPETLALGFGLVGLARQS